MGMKRKTARALIARHKTLLSKLDKAMSEEKKIADEIEAFETRRQLYESMAKQENERWANLELEISSLTVEQRRAHENRSKLQQEADSIIPLRERAVNQYGEVMANRIKLETEALRFQNDVVAAKARLEAKSEEEPAEAEAPAVVNVSPIKLDAMKIKFGCGVHRKRKRKVNVNG